MLTAQIILKFCLKKIRFNFQKNLLALKQVLTTKIFPLELLSDSGSAKESFQLSGAPRSFYGHENQKKIKNAESQ